MKYAIVAAAIGLAPTALAAWAFMIEPSMLRVREVTLTPPRWPLECDGLRVAVLADLHVGSPWNGPENLARVVARTREARPDVVLLAGDYVIDDVVGGTFVPPLVIAAGLRDLDAPLGTFAVLGNHDHWLDAGLVTRAFESVGIRVLEDASVSLRKEACTLSLVGLSDAWEGRADVRGALAGVPDGAGPILAFTHNPDLFPKVPERVSLTIAGHTHGGQVWLPLLGRPVIPSSFGQRYAIGAVVERGRHLFVSSGIGTSTLPVRFATPPEISLLILKSREGA